jgi:serine/threonine protein kinase
VKKSKSPTGELVARRYVLLEELERGGMGTVWLAHDQKLGRNVALKRMRARSLEAFPDARERFEREAKTVASLRSTHVVQVHDYGVHEGTPFIAMELLEGESLKERLEQLGSMEVVETAIILRQTAKGLRAAHGADLVHRDLKPSNIFLAVRDDEEVVKLLDFGVVKAPMGGREDDTASGVLLGTPKYMSPEQARGLKLIDYRADLWSLAVILFRMLTGHNPFESDADAVGDIVIRVCVNPIPAASDLAPDIPPAFDAFFEKALQREPDDRFQSVDELVESFMICGEMSFDSLEERFADSGSGRASFRSIVEGRSPSLAPATDSKSRQDSVRRRRAVREESGGVMTAEAVNEDSTMRRLARSLPARRGPRVAAGIGALAALAVGGLAAHALFGPKVPVATTTAPSAQAPALAVEPSSGLASSATTPPTANQEPSVEPSSTPSPKASGGATPSVAVGPAKATAPPPPTAAPSASQPPEPDDPPEEPPPKWYDENKP